MAIVERTTEFFELRANQELVQGGHNAITVTDKIGAVVLKGRHPRPWFVTFGLAFLFVGVLNIAIAYLLWEGVGIWGINIPVGWGFAIINFVWWIGIGHAGTLISAILLLMRQRWRNSINRLAETMTLFAVMCAGMFPLLHLGRPWAFYWILPIPNILGIWPQFRSPLVWDVFAISTYFTVSLLFWYTGLIPDLATLRDKAKSRLAQVIYGILAVGWRNSASHWHRYEHAYGLLAALSTPLVVSVHSVVSLDFAVSLLPGWHVTLFPPYFVAGAIYSGFAMVLTLVIPLRAWYGMKDLITKRHLDWMAKIMLATGLVVGYGYVTEAFYGLIYSGAEYERELMLNRMLGVYKPLYWSLIFCNVLAIQALWVPWIRKHPGWLFLLSLIVNIGMWLERFVIVIISLHQDFVPSAWDLYIPTIWDWALLAGTIGFFVFGIFLFVRTLPMIPMFEMRHLLHELQGHRDGHGKGGHSTAIETEGVQETQR